MGNEYVKVVYCHRAYLTYMQSTSWETLCWIKHKLESRLQGRNIIILRYADDATLMAKWRRTKEPLESERGEWKSWLKAQHSENWEHGIWFHHFMANRWRNSGKKQWQTLFFWAPKSLQVLTAAMKLKTLAPWKKSYDQPRQHIKKQRHYFANKCLSSQGYDFSSGHVWMWELDYKEGWALKNWCFWTVVLEKTLESP